MGLAQNIQAKLVNPTFMVRFHVTMVLVWIVLIPPTLFFWPESILWLALMSLWANLAAHGASAQAVLAEKHAAEDNDVDFDDLDDRVTKLDEKLDYLIGLAEDRQSPRAEKCL